MTLMGKKILAGCTAALLACGLAACSGGNDGAASSTPAASESASAEASGAVESPAPGETPEIVYSEEGMPSLGGTAQAPLLEFPKGDAPADVRVRVLEQGSGAELGADAVAKVNYVGQVWGKNEPFDSSYSRNAPATFPLAQVIPGWSHTLAKAHVGDKLILSIPAKWGYGPSGGTKDGSIGATDTIAFYVEILDAWNAKSAGEAGATVETEADALPVDYTGELGQPITDIRVKEGAEAPAELKATVIARGSGAPLPEKGTYVLQFAAAQWDNAHAENTWAPTTANYPAGPRSVPSTQQIFAPLAGVPVGSRVLLSVPSKDNPAQAIAVVVDILSAV